MYHTVLENGKLSEGVLTCANGKWGSAIKLGYGSSNIIIQNNKVYSNCGEGIAATRSSNVTIIGNTVYDNKSVNIYIDNSFNIKVQNNISYCQEVFPIGIALGEEYYADWGARLKNVAITKNTVINCYIGIMAFRSYMGGTLTNITIANNYIPTAHVRGISLDNTANFNVLISDNVHFKDIYVRNVEGVTLSNNVKITQ